MARKNTLFDVDITKENPLITIVNHGKIPVVQVNDVSFYQRTRHGEKCRGYPYNCPVCRHAAECIIEIGRQKDDA